MSNAQNIITIKGLVKRYGEHDALGGLNLAFERGKITAIFGPNGCGKSTLLNILAGIVVPDEGECEIIGFRNFEFGYIFQNYRDSLLPWRNNWDNLAFPLQIQGVKKDEIKNRISELEKIFLFRVDSKKYPYELSGGQQQILAFMRAVITNPKILFIDEPFSALDYENNLLLREHLQKYYLSHKPTIILVTHNIEEAVHLASKIIVLSKKPAKVAEIIENPIDYPRNLQTLKKEEFHLVKDKVLLAFQKAANL